MPAGLVPMVEMSPPNALMAPPMPTKRAVPFKSRWAMLAASYAVCAPTPAAMQKAQASVKILVLIKVTKYVLKIERLFIGD